MTVIITVVYLMRLRFIKLCSKRIDNGKDYIDTVNAKPWRWAMGMVWQR